ncbi:hypothetical protein [Solicola sp. PLA-1-18]|uniref:hypothetical protein n=1 Tax=Solicola sp. PLA-1-18 TaxID=3380532 RepID=UPI003B7EDA2F
MTARVRPLRSFLVATATAVLSLTVLTAPSAPAAAEGSSSGASESSNGCVVHANGTGMGSYCITGAGGEVQTLRERFGKQKFDRCRFSKPREGTTVPFNPTPDEGQWWIRTCIDYLDWDTLDGGPGRQVNVHLAYLPNDYDTTYDPSPLSEFLWDRLAQTRATDFPTPFLQSRPTPVPRVGVPAYMTFRWLERGTQRVVAGGQYAGDADGGPYIENNNGPMRMRAQATKIRIDPLQNDMEQTICNQENPTYDEQAGPDPKKQASNCYILFKRSSATARDNMKKTDREIPESLGPVYIVRVAVYWRVEYSSDGGPWRTLGQRNADGGTELIQYTDQPLPVREAQASNVPPRFSLS